MPATLEALPSAHQCFENGRHPGTSADFSSGLTKSGACRSGACKAAGTRNRVPAGLQAACRHPAGTQQAPGTRDRVPAGTLQASSRHSVSGAGCLQAPAGTQQAPGIGCRVPAGTRLALGGQPNTVFKVVRKEEKILSSSHVTVAHYVCLKTPPYCDVRGRRERGRGEHKGTCPPSLDKIKFTR